MFASQQLIDKKKMRDGKKTKTNSDTEKREREKESQQRENIKESLSTKKHGKRQVDS